MAFRDGPFENWKMPAGLAGGVVVVAGVVLAVFLLLGDRSESLGDETNIDAQYGGARGAFDQVAAPMNSVLAVPVGWIGQAADWVDDYFFAVSENRRLKKQVAELEAWRDNAIALKNINARYEAMLQIRTEPEVPMVAARAVSESRGPFMNARLIDVGSRRGVRIGNPVVNEHGLVGRVVGVTGGVSRVLLLTDVASRTPVLVARSDARAIVVGDGGSAPRLEFLRGHDSIQPGDQILTSGDGGVLPRGLPVGVAAKGLDGSWRVRLYADRGPIDFVKVLQFQDFAQLADRRALNAAPLAAVDTAPPPSPEMTARIEAAVSQAEARRQAEAERAARAVAAAEAAARLQQQVQQQQAQQPPAVQPQPATPPATRPAAAVPPPAQKAPPQAAVPPPAQKAPPQKAPAQKAPAYTILGPSASDADDRPGDGDRP